MKGTRFYRVWQAMKARCCDRNNISFYNYGERGITYCTQWEDFLNFRDDLYCSYIEHSEKYGEKDTFLDRIDVEGNYKIDNVRWSTRKEQNRNKKTNIKWKGETACEASLRLGGGKTLVSLRLRNGWSMKDAFTIRAKNMNNRKS